MQKAFIMKNIYHFQQGLTNRLENIKEEDQIENIKNFILERFNMKNVYFLLGSGTSCPAIPNMLGLYKEVKKAVEGKEKCIQKEFEKIVTKVGENKLEDILGVLYSHKQYLDGIDDCPKMEQQHCDELISLIENTIYNSINIGFKKTEEIEVLNIYKTFYQKIALRNKDLSRIYIFTTNNDLYNETALDSLNMHYINGFAGGLRRYFNPALFNYTFSKRMDSSIQKFEPVENLVYLYKIHGSVNWVEDTSELNTYFNIKEISPMIPSQDTEHILIYPTPTKQNKSLGSPYVDLFREFQKKLLEPHSVLFIIGYSFSDEHINNIIYSALATNSTINVVIINKITDKPIIKIDDNRIFKIWGECEKDEGEDGEPIHYFKSIVSQLLPNVDAFKNDDNILSKFVGFIKNESIK